MTSSEFTTHLYGRLPQIYRDEDQKIGYPLRRYLESLIEGGFSQIISGINEFITLIDPDKIPEEFLPHLCNSFGLTYFPDLDSTYQRKFLSNVGEIMKRRGTYAGIHYLAKSLTGLESELEFRHDYEGETGNFLLIFIVSESARDFDNIEVSMKAIQEYVGYQVPFFITPVVLKRIASKHITSGDTYSGSFVTSYKQYYIGG